MQEIDQIRAEVDQIHNQMVLLFQKRLALTRKIWDLKKTQALPFFDAKREEQIIHRFDSVISDADEQKAVQGFSTLVLTESRKYLEAKLK